MTVLKEKIALVTGGSRGIGRAIAIALAQAGADVAINFVRNQQAAEEVAKTIQDAGGKAMVMQGDVADAQQIHQMFDTLESQWRPVDILVNNAGREKRVAAVDFPETDYDTIMNINLKGAFICAQHAIKQMIPRKWGRIINISSVHELTPTGFCTPYSMAKGGMYMMTRELAFSYSQYGITVNNIAPGAIRTDMNKDVLSDPAYEERVKNKIPAGIIGEPDDVAHLAVFLATPAARYITGASLFVDGGLALT